MATASTASVILDELTAAGTQLVFGIPGGVISPVFDALLDRRDLRLIVARHETTAVFMAMGYCYATGRPGVVLTTAGPGFTNALTGLAAAAAESLPIVLVSGEVAKATFGRGAVQEGSAYSIDTVGMARHFAKFAAQVSLPSTAHSVARRALSTALSGRPGPAFLAVPLDVGRSPAGETQVYGRVSSRFEVDDQACCSAVAALTRAQRPLVLAGNGARSIFSRRAMKELVERLSLPVMTTTKGKGAFPEDHPLYLGVFGLGGHDNVTAYLSAEPPDVIMICGTALNDISTNAWSPLLQARDTQIQIDIDAAQIGRNYTTDIGILGPLDAVLSRMLEYAPVTRVRRDIVPLRDLPPQPARSDKGLMSAHEAIVTIDEAAPPDAVMVSDIGEFMSAAVNLLRITELKDFILCLGLGSMGSGIGVAIGYQLAAPTRRVIALCGDGSFLMYGNELCTAVKYNAPVTFCILNDGRYNMCHLGHNDVYGRAPDLTIQPVDFVATAIAMGAAACKVTTVAELREAVRTPQTGPLVIDIRYDPDVTNGRNQRNAALRSFSGDPT